MKLLRLVSLSLLATAALLAQASRTATFVGTVTDSSGAIVAGAKVTALNKDTAFVANALTNAEGAYYLPFLAVGSYDLTVEAPGFKKFVQSGIQVRAAEVPRLDVKLEVGGVTETVQVTGGAPLLETETSLVSQTIDAKQLNEIPILQQKAHRILYYMIGVQNRGANSSVLGQSTNQLGFTLDGISGKTSVRDGIGDTNTSVQPDIDALAEAKIYTSGAPAEVGHAAGGMIAFTFKSGTNALHGSLEDRYTNKVMMHRNYLEQAARTNPFAWHQILSTISGPLVIPKLYNGRNRTFFLFGYGRHDERSNESQTSTIPDLDMLNGNFSFPRATGGGFPIFDPATFTQSGTTWTGQPFAGNIIPKARFDKVASNFLALDPWRAPNDPATSQYTRSGPASNFLGDTIYRSYRGRFDSKIDHQISAGDKFFIRNSYNRHRQLGRISAQVNNRLLDSAGFGFGRPEPVDQQNWAAAEYHTFSPTLMNEVRLGFNRRVDSVTPPTADQGWAQKLGIPNVGPQHFPTFGLFNIGPGAFNRGINEDMTFQENLTKVSGRGSWKFGYEMIRTRENNVAQSLPSGNYTFNTAGTAQPIATPNTGNNFASFLLGAVSSASFTQLLSNELPRWSSHSLYVQTDWKPIPGLTFNLGLRYSYETPFNTKYGQKSQFDPTAPDALSGRIGAIVHPKGSVYRSDRNNFQPRVGMAWTFRPKTVFRASWGVLTQDLLPSAGTQEYSSTANVNSAVGDPRPAFYLSQGPPNRNFVINPDGTSPTLISNNNFSGRGATYLDPGLRVPYVMNWSAGVQFDLGNNWVHELLYQGAAGVGTTSTVNLNQLPQSIYQSTDLTLLNAARTNTQNYRPITNFGTINWTTNAGHNTYHGFVARIEKRYSNGLSLNAFWTLSKNLSGGMGDGWQYYNWGLTKGVTSFDTRHRVIITAMYELPFGKGRKLLNSGGVINHILGGWQINWIETIQSGQAITFSYGGSPNLYLPGGPSRPNQISDNVKVDNYTMGIHRFPQGAQNPYYNMSAFAYPASYTPGTLGIGTQTGLWQFWPQWGLAKSWKFYERVTFRLRLDGNNIPVRRQFTNPDSSVNFTNPQNFGRFGGGGTAFSTLGTANGHVILGGRIEF